MSEGPNPLAYAEPPEQAVRASRRPCALVPLVGGGLAAALAAPGDRPPLSYPVLVRPLARCVAACGAAPAWRFRPRVPGLSLWPLLRLRWPSRTSALDRLDRDTGLNHGPARVLDDTLALGSADLGTRALWALHRRRAEEAIGRMRVAPPRPDMPRHDRYALRAAGLLALVASAFVAGPELGSRLAAAFDWRRVEALGAGLPHRRLDRSAALYPHAAPDDRPRAGAEPEGTDPLDGGGPHRRRGHRGGRRPDAG